MNPGNARQYIQKLTDAMISLKGGLKKCPDSKFVYSISHLNQHRNFKILLSYMGGIMGGRDKNVKDPMLV